MSNLSLPLFAALRDSFRQGYSLSSLRSDVLAGITVGIIAIPLAMALAIAVGVAPQHGLYTGIVGGLIIALFGGSRFNISGPTAAFVVILLPITQAYGLGGLLLVTLMAGAILVVLGVARMGNLIQFVPYPVVMGFTAGIGIVIATLQIKDFFGLQNVGPHTHYLDQLQALGQALPSISPGDTLVGAVTLTVLILWPRLTRRIPGHLVALLLGSLLGLLLMSLDVSVATLGSRFSYELDGVTHAGIPPLAPQWVLPWKLPGADGQPLLINFELLRQLLPSALAVAMLGAIESLLCALVADGMAGTRHDPNAELIGQGLGNMVVPFFGGITATAAIARTATSVRSGARSPIAAVVHALVILLAVVLLARLFAWLPMASLAAMLLMVAWNMSEAKRVIHLLRVGPRQDVLVLLICLLLTVLFDMVLAVGVGLLLASALFIKRMADLSEGARARPDRELQVELPDAVVLYRIQGPLFFAAADKALRALSQFEEQIRYLIIDMRAVPSMDMSALVLFEQALGDIRRRGVQVYLSGVKPRIRLKLKRAGIHARRGEIGFTASPELAARLIRAQQEDAAPVQA
ncbi:C4-dicarboxylic acid transporter DauA [Halopseudomonas formosensis]|jgi:SulP family sulfate permease|uniref:C4-dicarboxylic acid transporter DauA n=1 Tax=Halopseudomonas formosensis TaxID=1002526 RepID=A0A1I5ZHT5_9GAMM|nr:C4-dicarboxylic acid transporter DauA [Halopseudomonas formosensis]MDX9688033.1 C4-dicarboxylic acid transporter DauA [Halopseudomonas formosensis]NLC02101.1 C4-dicarboxylic acid transporter DauA [Halopseudomonas formosensis]SFQ56001.1 sulfate permease, SulP family [Halopseudomonas formosensis]